MKVSIYHDSNLNLMAASSFSTTIRRYHVFPSFHGPDVRKTFLSHLQKLFASKGITTFKDQEIERGYTIGPELIQAIRESRVSIIVLSKKYASSSWCLDELVEVLKCKEDGGQIVMTIFYRVDPSDVRKQAGDFGIAFEEACQGKTEEQRLKWSLALTHVANIAGEHSLNWDDEGEMIEKIAADVSNKLNVTPSRDFEGMVGMEAHLRKLNSLLRLESDEVKITGIWGAAGIGKSTIARALYNQLSSDFRLKCFMGNLGRSYKSVGVDDYDMKLFLQNQLLSKILNQKNMRIHHLGAVKEWLQDQRVLIVLDDVDDLEQLEVLAKEPSWFGSGSRILVTSEDKRILKAHEIDDIYHVGFLSKQDALEIFCLSAFKRSSPRGGFEELAEKVAKLCGSLPLGLRVVGSSLRGQSKVEWELQLYNLETSLDRKIEDVLRVGYDKLSKKHQAIFLHIACFFNNEDVDHVTSMLADSNLDVNNGLRILVDKSLVHISADGKIVMHYLLQKLGRQEVVKQSRELGKRQFLVEAEDVLNVLANGAGTEFVIGISFDMSKTGVISWRVFEGMRNLQFLRVYMGDPNKNVSLCTLDDMEFLPSKELMEFLPRLRLLHWNSYPRAHFPPTFRSEYLIELHMPSSKLEKLWEGIQPLVNLKKVNLNFSSKLKEIPNLSKATNLETLTLIQCTSLVKFPSILNLYKLKTVRMWGCKKLQVVSTITSSEPPDIIFARNSLFRSFPDISRNIKNLSVGGPSLFGHQSRHKTLDELYRRDVVGREYKRLAHVPESLRKLDLSCSDIERIPNYVSGLHRLHTLIIENCTRLVSLENLPGSLMSLRADNCVSLERVTFPVFLKEHGSIRELMFHNCLKLNEDARREIIRGGFAKFVCLPGTQIPVKFTHNATANSITISPGSFSSASSRFKACLLLWPVKDNTIFHVNCYIKSQGVRINQINYVTRTSDQPPQVRTPHLFIICGDWLHQQNRSLEVDVNKTEVLFEFTCSDHRKIIECGVQILKKREEKSPSALVCLNLNTNDNLDNNDGDEGDNISPPYHQVENVESPRLTGCFSFLRKRVLRKKQLTKA